MINVESKVTIYEVDGIEQKSLDMPTLLVCSHWNQDALVVIHAAGKRLTVRARDLRAALDNAINVARFG